MFLKKKKKNYIKKMNQTILENKTYKAVSNHGHETVFHFLKRFLIGLIGFCIIVNTMNIWMDIYGVVPHLALKLGKLLKHMTQNWTSIVESNEREMCSSLYFIAINRY